MEIKICLRIVCFTAVCAELLLPCNLAGGHLVLQATKGEAHQPAPQLVPGKPPLPRRAPLPQPSVQRGRAPLSGRPGPLIQPTSRRPQPTPGLLQSTLRGLQPTAPGGLLPTAAPIAALARQKLQPPSM